MSNLLAKLFYFYSACWVQYNSDVILFLFFNLGLTAIEKRHVPKNAVSLCAAGELPQN